MMTRWKAGDNSSMETRSAAATRGVLSVRIDRMMLRRDDLVVLQIMAGARRAPYRIAGEEDRRAGNTCGAWRRSA
jgi:hypothetical protein